jgi:hypothetical protein
MNIRITLVEVVGGNYDNDDSSSGAGDSSGGNT